MAYTPTTWSAGDTITSAKLNKIEQGIVSAGEGGIYLVNIIYNENEGRWETDKTYNEIKTAFVAGKTVIFKQEVEEGDSV